MSNTSAFVTPLRVINLIILSLVTVRSIGVIKNNTLLSRKLVSVVANESQFSVYISFLKKVVPKNIGLILYVKVSYRWDDILNQLLKNFTKLIIDDPFDDCFIKNDLNDECNLQILVYILALIVK